MVYDIGLERYKDYQICGKDSIPFFQKYVSNHLISLLYNFHFIFRRRYLIIKKRFWKRAHPNSWFWTSSLHSNSVTISDYTSWKCFICLKWILKNLSTTLHIRFNYLTMLVCPSKPYFPDCPLSWIWKKTLFY